MQSKYAQSENVAIVEADISRREFSLERKFDIISAIGVIFHVVDDALWRQALVNMRERLNDDGVIIIGGCFGWITKNTQFHVTDDFETAEQAMHSIYHGVSSASEIYFNKRVRSLRQWKTAAAETGLRVQQVVRTTWHFGIHTPENNIMVLTRRP